MAAAEQGDGGRAGDRARSRAPARLRWDAAAVAVVVLALTVACLLGRPPAWLTDWYVRSVWAQRVLVLLALTHLVMMVFGARRGADLRREMAERLAARAELQRQAATDGLTGLANRSSFLTAVRAALGDAAPVAVVLADLDRFKQVNDTLGHAVGDRLLQAAADRLVRAVPERGLIARLGGDEFAVLLPDADAPSASAAVQLLLDAVREPFEVDGLAVEVDGSFGIALSPQHGDEADVLLRHADVAMYAAKNAQRGLQVYSADLDDHDPGRLALYGELKRGIAAGQLRLLFQPKVELASGRVLGVEALVRWQHPTRGLLSPDAFLPVAEQSGLIRSLTDVVLDQALAAGRRWRDSGLQLTVAVNLSARSLLDSELPARIVGALAAHDLPAHVLELEVTETAAMTNPAQAAHILGRLQAAGVAVSVDDYGTGHASLAYLSRLPIRNLKIDRSFVLRMASDPADATIVRSTIELGHNLGLAVVAEGVETADVYRQLTSLGCDQAQGFWMAAPLPEHELLTCLDRLAAHIPVQPRPESLPVHRR